jgi:hypothetical protein
MNIFLSYRRDDSAGHAGRLTDVLEAALGDEAVFQDVEAIAPGTDFVDAIDKAIGRCQAVLVLIGPDWIGARDAQGNRRLDSDSDFVRLEIVRALERGIRVVPVLVGGAKMPSQVELPPPLRPLARLQAFEISDGRWAYDTGQLITALGGRRAALVSRRRVLQIAGVVVAVDAIALGTWLLLRDPPEVGGRWNLPSGSYWVVTRTGSDLAIEETHYDSKEVWKRGHGRFEPPTVHYELQYVFEKGATEKGRLELSDDRKVFRGEAEQMPSGSRAVVTLTR